MAYNVIQKEENTRKIYSDTISGSVVTKATAMVIKHIRSQMAPLRSLHSILIKFFHASAFRLLCLLLTPLGHNILQWGESKKKYK